MSEPINFVVTDAGLNSLLEASDKSINLSLTKVGLGTARYVATHEQTALRAKFTENGISAGGVDVGTASLRFTVIMNHQYESPVSEIGLYTSSGVLFAVASKPSGDFFRLYPSIDYVANLGLRLENTADIGSVEFVLDGRGGKATELMQMHIDTDDPHPQYRGQAEQLMREHLSAPDPHPQYANKLFMSTEVKKLDSKIESLIGITEYLFPPMIEAGFSLLPASVALRRKGANYTWLNRSIVYHICPESTHEGWTSVRQATQIATNIFSRNNANRVPYNGRANYMVIDTERTLQGRGFLDATNQLANEIKSGVFEAGEKLSIHREAWESLSYATDDVAVMITPEGEHEGWEITRTTDRIDINVFNRSGLNRVGHGGRVNWTLFKVNGIPYKRDKYPFNLITGLTDRGNFTINAPLGYDFNDSNFFVMVSPESAHEGWNITRTKLGFNVEVYNRSGQNKIDYVGQVSWAVFMLAKSTKRTVLGPGTHDFEFKADCNYQVTVVGGGGGGGNAIFYHSGATPLAAEDGTQTTITAGGFSVIATGGRGGTRGCWNNGSAYRDGISGDGGTLSYINGYAGFNNMRVEFENGAKGIMAENNAGNGGLALYGEEHDGAGRGGKGKAGSGSRSLGFGGSGGGGGSGLVMFNCHQNIGATITVGSGGKVFNDPEEYYQKGWHHGFGLVGNHGLVVIEETDAE